jgi:hypothetical protein
MRSRTVKQLVLDAVSSPLTRVMYARALEDFFAWWEEQDRPAFMRATGRGEMSPDDVFDLRRIEHDAKSATTSN